MAGRYDRTEFKTRLTLKPGDPGTIKLCQRYGAQLFAVRYHYNRQGTRRLKTVELVIDDAAGVSPKRSSSKTDGGT